MTGSFVRRLSIGLAVVALGCGGNPHPPADSYADGDSDADGDGGPDADADADSDLDCTGICAIQCDNSYDLHCDEGEALCLLGGPFGICYPTECCDQLCVADCVEAFESDCP